MNAFLSVHADVTAAITGGEASSRPRAVKVTVDSKGECLVAERIFPAGASLAEDFAAIPASLDDAVPCLVLVRLADEAGTLPGAGSADWAMVAWTPGASPVKLKMLCASSRKTLRDACDGLRIKEYPVSEKDEVTFEQFCEATRPKTDKERLDAMTNEEIDAMQAREASKKEQRAAPKMLAGLVALQVKAEDSFNEAVAKALEGPGTAVLARLSGTGGESLGGEVLGDVKVPQDLKGKLPSDAPCYVVMARGEDRLLLISWLPDGAPAKLRMKCSTFKASVVQLLRDMAGSRALVTAEVSDEDDLAEDLGRPAPAAAGGAPGGGEAGEAKPAGFRPPVGGFALPGMGAKPPPGGVALPGMGAKPPPGGVALPGFGAPK